MKFQANRCCGKKMFVVKTAVLKPDVRQKVYKCCRCGARKQTFEIQLNDIHWNDDHVLECFRCPHNECVLRSNPFACPIVLKFNLDVKVLDNVAL